MSENLQTLSFELDAEDLAVIDEVLEEGSMLPGEPGDEYRK